MIGRIARVSLWRMLIGIFVGLMILQMFVDPGTFEVISIGALCVAFGFKSIVNTISAYTMYRQQGTSALARACMRYFWSLDAMSVLLSVLFLLAFTDRVAWALPGSDLTIVRNLLRSFVITSVVAVGILGSQMMSALFDFLREQIATRRMTPSATGTTYIEAVALEVWRETGGHAPTFPEHEATLWLGYAVLVLAKGVETTSRDVHDAWSAWAVRAYPFHHRSAIPFDQLAPEIQGYDDEYRDAIRRVAMRSAEAP